MLAFTLVFQSYAVATMVTCGPTHARMQAEMVERGDQSQPHHLGEMEHHASSTNVADLDHERSNAGDVFKLKCSACASCCASAAIPVRQIRIESVHVTFEAVSATHSPAADFVVSRPTPPPRVFLA
ncbi:MAG: hypothetical protein ACREBN_05025 [Burkholderiaceae bacterium]